MGYTVLERCLQVDRGRRRAAREGGFATPVMHERKVVEDVTPLLVTNARGVLMASRPSSSGVLRCGMFACEIDQEDALVASIYRTLEITAHVQGWDNRCATLSEALDRMQAAGMEGKTVIFSDAVAKHLKVDPSEARRVQAVQGYVTMHQGLQALVATLPGSAALVVASPAQAGVHVRVNDHVGIMLTRVDRAYMMVADGMAG